jgi:hypothetical protein
MPGEHESEFCLTHAALRTRGAQLQIPINEKEET